MIVRQRNGVDRYLNLRDGVAHRIKGEIKILVHVINVVP